MYRVELASSAAQELEKIHQFDQKLYGRLIMVIESLRNNPYQGKKLKGRMKGDYSVRVGDYRIVYDVYKDKLIIVVIDVGHRREIYR